MRDRNTELAEKVGRMRDILAIVAERGPNVSVAEEYRALRAELVSDERIADLLPEFIIECRNTRDFWNYIQRAFSSYASRSQYIEAQLLPIERQFRPERSRAPGIRPPEVRIEYSPIQPPSLGAQTFVSETRVAQLRAITSSTYDLCKLIRLCEEINVTYANGALLATAMLIRSILDHIPPIFAMPNFSQVANNYAGPRSFNDVMRRLDEAARRIADGYLHLQIRTNETLPEPQQVNFAAEVDVLLAEIIRILA